MKTMKSIFILSLVMLMGLAVYGQAFARGGFGKCMRNTAASSDTSATASACPGRGLGPGNGTGPVANIFEGEAVTLTDVTIAEIAYYGQGFKVDTGTEVVTVYGLGPIWYWEQLGTAYPAVGDAITVNAYNVTFSDGSVKLIAASVVIGDAEIALRDSETGAPIWRGQNRGFRGKCGACPYAAPAAEATE